MKKYVYMDIYRVTGQEPLAAVLLLMYRIMIVMSLKRFIIQGFKSGYLKITVTF